MALIKFKDAYPNYRETFKNSGNREAAHFDEYSVYSGNDKVGSVKDALFEQNTGNIRYLVVDTGFWIFGKDILLPVGLAHFDYDQRRVHVDGLTKQQVENLPEYREDMTVDRDYEDRVRSSYRDMGVTRSGRYTGREYNADTSASYPGSAALYGAKQYKSGQSNATANAAASANSYDYNSEPGLYGMDRESHEPIRLYQERLVADKDRFKAGSVTVGKRVKSDTQEVSVPVENERVVIERHQPTSTTATNRNPDFKEGEVAHMDVYAEKADVRKEAFVREEVDVRKEVDRDTVSGREKVRREELDIDTNDNPDVVQR
ncbi:MAG: DUF2382 domain-containing protein [Thainema sp.]